MNHVLKKIIRPLRPQALTVPRVDPPPVEVTEATEAELATARHQLAADHVAAAIRKQDKRLGVELELTPADVLALRQAEEKRQRKLARRTT